jgi:DNA-binding response OmpR family regulator/chromosome segregation ATPase
MSTKVLVFESDAAFAGELRNELGKLGCSTCVVDDGSVGLQQASAEKPDLILLSIELPRMNGFSVCNKLKKDAALKDVPLIIMSSESSDETFEQHRKLRTRAEDYVHKPIAFGELLSHIRSFVQVGSSSTSGADADGIVIDDEIALQHVEEIDDDEEQGTEIAMRPDFDELRKMVDPEVDSFTDEVFGRLQHAPPQGAARDFNGGGAASSTTSIARENTGVLARPGGAPAQAAPTANLEGELAKLRSELERQQNEVQRAESKAAFLEKELLQAHEQISRIHQETDTEVERLQRDLQELKGRTSLPPKAGVSSREFLDLRETLNKKDKEILALKTQLTGKDKEIFDVRDRSLALERQTSELDDRILAKDREFAEASDRVDEVTETLASREAELADLKRAIAETEAALESTKTELGAAQTKGVEERASFEATISVLKKESAEALARAEESGVKALEEALTRHHAELDEKAAAHRSELEAGEAARRAEVEQVAREREAAVDEAQRRAVNAQAEAVARRENELRVEMESKVEALQRAQQEELARSQSEAQRKLEGALQEASETLASRERELESRRADEVFSLSAKATSDLAEATGRITDLERDLQKSQTETSELAGAKRASDAQNEAHLAELQARLSDTATAKGSLEAELASTRDRIAALEVDLSSVRGDLQLTQRRLETQASRADRAFAKWDADRASLERAKDALAVALAKLDEAEARPIQDG